MNLPSPPPGSRRLQVHNTADPPASSSTSMNASSCLHNNIDAIQQQQCSTASVMSSGTSAIGGSMVEMGNSFGLLNLNPVLRRGGAGSLAAGVGPSSNSSASGGGGISPPSPPSVGVPPPLSMAPFTCFISFLSFLPRSTEIFCRQFDAIVMEMLFKVLTATKSAAQAGEEEKNFPVPLSLTSSYSSSPVAAAAAAAALVNRGHHLSGGATSRSVLPEKSRFHKSREEVFASGGGGPLSLPISSSSSSVLSCFSGEEQDTERKSCSHHPALAEEDQELLASPILREAIIQIGFIGCKRLVDVMWTLLYGATRAEVEMELYKNPPPPPSFSSFFLTPHPFGASLAPSVPSPFSSMLPTAGSGVGGNGGVVSGEILPGGGSGNSSAPGTGAASVTVASPSVNTTTTTTTNNNNNNHNHQHHHLSPCSGSGNIRGDTLPRIPKSRSVPTSTTSVFLEETIVNSPLSRPLMGKAGAVPRSSSAASASGGTNMSRSASSPASPPTVQSKNHMTPSMMVALEAEKAKNIFHVTSPSVKCDYKNELIQCLLKQLFFSPPSFSNVAFPSAPPMTSAAPQLSGSSLPLSLPIPPSSYLQRNDNAYASPSALKSCNSSSSIKSNSSYGSTTAAAAGSGSGGAGDHHFSQEGCIPSSSCTPFSDSGSGGGGGGGSGAGGNSGMEGRHPMRHSMRSPPPPSVSPSCSVPPYLPCLAPSPPSYQPQPDANFRRQVNVGVSVAPPHHTSGRGSLLPTGEGDRRCSGGGGEDGGGGRSESGRERGKERYSTPPSLCSPPFQPNTTSTTHTQFPAGRNEVLNSWVPDSRVEEWLIPLFPTLLPMMSSLDARDDDKGATLRLLTPEGIHHAFCTILVHHHIQEVSDILLLLNFFIESLTEEWYRQISSLSPGLFPHSSHLAGLTAFSPLPGLAVGSGTSTTTPMAMTTNTAGPMASSSVSSPSPSLVPTNTHTITVGGSHMIPASFPSPPSLSSMTPFMATATATAAGGQGSGMGNTDVYGSGSSSNSNSNTVGHTSIGLGSGSPSFPLSSTSAVPNNGDSIRVGIGNNAGSEGVVAVVTIGQQAQQQQQQQSPSTSPSSSVAALYSNNNNSNSNNVNTTMTAATTITTTNHNNNSSASVVGGVSKAALAAIALTAVPAILQQWFEQHLRSPLIATLDVIHRTTTALPPPPPPSSYPLSSSPLVPTSPMMRSTQPTFSGPIPPIQGASSNFPLHISSTLPNLTDAGQDVTNNKNINNNNMNSKINTTTTSPMPNSIGHTSSNSGGMGMTTSRELLPLSSNLPLLSSVEARPKGASRTVSPIARSSSPYSSGAWNTAPCSAASPVGAGIGAPNAHTSSSPHPLGMYFPHLSAEQRSVARAHSFFRECCPIKFADPRHMHDPAKTPRVFQDAWTKASSFVLHSTDLVFLQPSNKSVERENESKSSPESSHHSHRHHRHTSNENPNLSPKSSRRRASQSVNKPSSSSSSSPSSHSAAASPPQVSYEWASSNKMWSIRTRLISLRGHYLYIYNGLASSSVLTEHIGDTSKPVQHSSTSNNGDSGNNTNPNSNNSESNHMVQYPASKSLSHPPLTATASSCRNTSPPSSSSSFKAQTPQATAAAAPPPPPPVRLADVLCYDSPIALIDLCRLSGSPVYLVSGPHDVESVALRTPGKATGWREMPLWSKDTSSSAPLPPLEKTKGPAGSHDEEDNIGAGGTTGSSSTQASTGADAFPKHPLATATIEDTEILRTCNGRLEVQLLTLPIPSSVLAAAGLAQNPLIAPSFISPLSPTASPPLSSTPYSPVGQRSLMEATHSSSLNSGLSMLALPSISAQDSRRRLSHSYKGPNSEGGQENSYSFTAPMLMHTTANSPCTTSPAGSASTKGMSVPQPPAPPGVGSTTTTTPTGPPLVTATFSSPSSSFSFFNLPPPPPPPPLPSVTVQQDYIAFTMRWLNQNHYKNVSGGPIRQRMYPIRLLVKNELHHFLFQSPGERAKWYHFFEQLTWTYHSLPHLQRITRSFRSYYSFIRNRFPYPVGPAAFEAIALLGAGTYGHVLLVRHKLTRKQFAMKVVRKNNFLSLRSIIEARREHAMLESLDCPYIMKLHDTFQTDSCVYFLLDFLSGGDLLKHIQNAPDHHLTENMSRFVIAEVAIALEHLRVRGIVHRDLKGDNLVMDAEGHVVLTDFGFAKQITVPRQEEFPKIISLASSPGGPGAGTSMAAAAAVGSVGGGGSGGVMQANAAAGGGGGGRLPSIVGANGSGRVGRTSSGTTANSILSTAPLLTYSKSGSLRYHLTNEEQSSCTSGGVGGGGGTTTSNNNNSSSSNTTNLGVNAVNSPILGGGNFYTMYPYQPLYNPSPFPLLSFNQNNGVPGLSLAVNTGASCGNSMSSGGGGSSSSNPHSSGSGVGAGSVVVLPQHNSCGTVAYIAPEVLRSSHQGDGYGLEVDWWSMGIVLFTLLTGLFPFFKDTPRETSHDILHSAVRFPHEMRGGKHMPTISKEAQHLVLCLLEKRPEKRLCCLRDLKQHPFFKGFDWEACEARRLAPPQELHVDIYSPPCSSRDVVERLKRRVEWATSLQSHPHEQPPVCIPVEEVSPYQTSEGLGKDFSKLASELGEIGKKYGIDPPPVETVENDIFNPLYARQERCGSDRDIFRAHHDVTISTQKSCGGHFLGGPHPTTSLDGFGSGGNGVFDSCTYIEGELAEDYIPKIGAHPAPTVMMNGYGSAGGFDGGGGGPPSFSTVLNASSVQGGGGGMADAPMMSNMSGSFSLLWGGGGVGHRTVQNAFMGMSTTFPFPPIDLEMGLSSEEGELGNRNNNASSYGSMSVGVMGDLSYFSNIDPILDDYDDMAYQSHGLREVNYIRDGDTSLYRPAMNP